MTDQQQRPTRRDLIDAQRDIFRNQDKDQREGATDETPGHQETHRRYYEIEKQVPKQERRGVWDQALAEHEKERDGHSSHPWLDYERPHDGTWYRRDEGAER